ncbi:hypothetical protein BT63DRAFT_450746 [Microthyrium microscopicum]|uniref:Uncharacterized protein n=1 Tax=Microthyrium microscopicum TaxID=703497 RepID=A0A6A6ULR2_9PEZI|nr:hypothetical protein BT63DRAFT_450746 [Microthyrium microscopicum]
MPLVSLRKILLESAASCVGAGGSKADGDAHFRALLRYHQKLYGTTPSTYASQHNCFLLKYCRYYGSQLSNSRYKIFITYIANIHPGNTRSPTAIPRTPNKDSGIALYDSKFGISLQNVQAG